MKRIIFFLVAVFVVSLFMAIYFCFPPKARAGEKEIRYQQVILEICQTNFEMADKWEAVLRQNNDTHPYYVYDKDNKVVSLVPNSSLFIIVKELIKRDRGNINYQELAEELIDSRLMLRAALKRINPKLGKK